VKPVGEFILVTEKNNSIISPLIFWAANPP